MRDVIRTRLNDPTLLAAREAHMARLRALFAGRPADNLFVLRGINGAAAGGSAAMYTDPEDWTAAALADLAERADALPDPRVFRPLVVNPGPYGVHFIDRIFGAEVFELDGEAGNWQAHTLSTPVGALRHPDLETDATWALARRLARAFLDADVRVPLFGVPTLSSPLNIALNLYGGEFMLALLAEPEAARHDLRVITDVIAALHRWYLQHVPLDRLQMIEARGRAQPPGYGQICGCSTQLVSPGQYDAFMAGPDEGILALYPHGGMIHLCGAHAQHIPTWRAMPALRAVQLNDRAAEDLALYHRGLRADQMLYVNPCDEMPAEEIVSITGGRRLVLVADIDEKGYRRLAERAAARA
jgi:hypothetical protein